MVAAPGRSARPPPSGRGSPAPACFPLSGRPLCVSSGPPGRHCPTARTPRHPGQSADRCGGLRGGARAYADGNPCGGRKSQIDRRPQQLTRRAASKPTNRTARSARPSKPALESAAPEAVLQHIPPHADVIVAMANGEPPGLLDALERHNDALDGVRIHQMHALHSAAVDRRARTATASATSPTSSRPSRGPPTGPAASTSSRTTSPRCRTCCARRRSARSCSPRPARPTATATSASAPTPTTSRR